jgi:hypothetical protein
MVEMFVNKDEEKSKLFLKLVQDGDRVDLVLVNKDGVKHRAGNVLYIDKNGLHRHSSITSDAPFARNSDGEIEVSDD